MSVPLIVLDTGVAITALIGNTSAASYRLCRAIGTGQVRIATSDRFLYELVGVVRRKTAEGLITDPAKAFEVALDIGFYGEPHRFEPMPWPSVDDVGDWWMPDLAYHATADFIVAWDHHLRDATLPIPVEVITPPEMADRLGI